MPDYSPLPAKLIYSPTAGSPQDSAERLAWLLEQLQALGIEPEVFTTHSSSQSEAAAAAAAQRGMALVIACGGDGTLASVANGLIGTTTVLGILPGGTRNNISGSLGIPDDLGAAVQRLRTGRRLAIDAALARCNGQQRYFFENLTIGIFSAILPDADAVQKGDLRHVDDLFLKFVNAPEAVFQLSIDDGRQVMEARAQAAIGINMPATGMRFRLAPDIAYTDGLLDLFVFDQLNKLDLLAYSWDVITGDPDNARIMRLRVRQASIRTDPALPIMADAFPLGSGAVDIRVAPGCITVIQ